MSTLRRSLRAKAQELETLQNQTASLRAALATQEKYVPIVNQPDPPPSSWGGGVPAADVNGAAERAALQQSAESWMKAAERAQAQVVALKEEVNFFFDALEQQHTQHTEKSPRNKSNAPGARLPSSTSTPDLSSPNSAAQNSNTSPMSGKSNGTDQPKHKTAAELESEFEAVRAERSSGGTSPTRDAVENWVEVAENALEEVATLRRTIQDKDRAIRDRDATVQSLQQQLDTPENQSVHQLTANQKASTTTRAGGNEPTATTPTQAVAQKPDLEPYGDGWRLNVSSADISEPQSQEVIRLQQEVVRLHHQIGEARASPKRNKQPTNSTSVPDLEAAEQTSMDQDSMADVAESALVEVTSLRRALLMGEKTIEELRRKIDDLTQDATAQQPEKKDPLDEAFDAQHTTTPQSSPTSKNPGRSVSRGRYSPPGERVTYDDVDDVFNLEEDELPRSPSATAKSPGSARRKGFVDKESSITNLKNQLKAANAQISGLVEAAKNNANVPQQPAKHKSAAELESEFKAARAEKEQSQRITQAEVISTLAITMCGWLVHDLSILLVFQCVYRCWCS